MKRSPGFIVDTGNQTGHDTTSEFASLEKMHDGL